MLDLSLSLNLLESKLVKGLLGIQTGKFRNGSYYTLKSELDIGSE
jgi:hypothetical protein